MLAKREFSHLLLIHAKIPKNGSKDFESSVKNSPPFSIANSARSGASRNSMDIACAVCFWQYFTGAPRIIYHLILQEDIMNTSCTCAALGTGDYRQGVPYSELKVLIEEGNEVMRARGLEGEDLHRAARIYARTMVHFYEQSGWQPLSKALENEFVERVIAELAVGRHSHHRTNALTAAQFSHGLALYDPRMDGLEPFTPARFPDPDPHPHPRTPEEFVEPLPSPITNEQGTRCCLVPDRKTNHS